MVADRTRSRIEPNASREQHVDDLVCDGLDASGGEVVVTYRVNRQVTKPELDVRLVSSDEVAVKVGSGRVSFQKLPHPVMEESLRVQKFDSNFVIKFRKKAKIPESMDISDDMNSNSHGNGLSRNGTSHVDDLDMSPSPPKIRRVENVKTDFSENSDEVLIVYLYVKGIEKDSLKVDFRAKELAVTFATSDSKFLSAQPLQQGDSTMFLWDVPLKAEINASQCTYKLTGAKLELRLSKKMPGKWGGFMPPAQKPQDSSASFGELRPPAVHWVNASSGGDAGSVKLAPVSLPKDMPKARTTSGKDANWNATRRLDLSNNNDSNSDEEPFGKSDPEEPEKSPVKSDSEDDDFFYRGAHHSSVRTVAPGMTGLDNIGNTCFMNSIIQCLSNTRDLRDYFLRNDYQRELNRENPLGMQGKLALAFGSLLHVIWSGREMSVAPYKIKNVLAHKASQFLGFAQHDAHEFMAFLLDGLHEDLNRVREKPYTKAVDSKGRPDADVANDAWKMYKMRNDSVIVDLFQGQYRSKLICPACDRVSITFDPFLYLSVPLPKKKRTFNVVFFPLNGSAEPFKFAVRMPADGTLCDLAAETEKLLGVRKEKLRITIVTGSLFDEIPPLKTSVFSALHRYQNSSIHMFELLDEIKLGHSNDDADERDPVVEFRVTQRLTSPPEIQACSACRREPRKGHQLMRCKGCLRVAYCDQRCQADHWGEHHRRCKLTADLIGRPFIVSLRRSEATFFKLVHAMESSARHSVTVFQPPVGGKVGELVPQGLAKDGHISRDDSCPTTPCGPISASESTLASSSSIALPPLASNVAGSHESPAPLRLSSHFDSPVFSPVPDENDRSSSIVVQGLNTSSQSVLKHTLVKEDVKSQVSAGISEAAADVPEDVEMKLRRSFESRPETSSDFPALTDAAPSPRSPAPSLILPVHEQSPRMVAAGNPADALDSDDDAETDVNAAGDTPSSLVNPVDDGINNNNEDVSSVGSTLNVDEAAASGVDVRSIRSDVTSVEHYVKRRYPQFDVFVLPRHQSSRTHCTELTQLIDEGDKPLELRDRCLEIVMDWRNCQRLEGFVAVQARTFDPPTRHLHSSHTYDQPVVDSSKAEPKSSTYSLRQNSIGRDESILRGFFSSGSSSSPSSNSDDFTKFNRRGSVVTALDDDDEEKATVHDCLQLFSEPERLSKAEAWYCSGCKQHREATKELSLWRLPNILVLQLKRFSFKTIIFRDKIDRLIRFPVSGLDVSPYCASGEKAVYDLYGVVNHYGSMIGGHYTSYVRLCSKEDSRRSEVGWRLCDDSHVTYVDDASVVSRSAYVLFYKRRDAHLSTSDVDEPLAKVPSSLLRDSLRVSPDPKAATSTAQLSTALHEQQQQEEKDESRRAGLKKEDLPIVTDL